MTEAQTVTSEVEVAVEPAVAFSAFTDEMDLWWVRGPINFWSDAARVVEIRCEPGVGGRILEVLDDPDTGEVFERARLTRWEPGVLVAWTSPLDDVETQVRFVATDMGTRVVVEHRIPPGGADRGGTAWSRVVPSWFGPWCARRDSRPHAMVDIARLALAVNYARPAAAAHWLADVFGFQPVDDLPTDPDPLPEGEHGPPWIEFRIGNASLMVFKRETDSVDGAPAHVPWVYVDDFDAHLARAEAGGAKIRERRPWPFLATYVAEDVEGNRWTFAQARPTQQ